MYVRYGTAVRVPGTGTIARGASANRPRMVVVHVYCVRTCCAWYLLRMHSSTLSTCKHSLPGRPPGPGAGPPPKANRSTATSTWIHWQQYSSRLLLFYSFYSFDFLLWIDIDFQRTALDAFRLLLTSGPRFFPPQSCTSSIHSRFSERVAICQQR